MSVALYQLKLIMPSAGMRAIAAHPHLDDAMDRFQISFGVRAAGFLATIAAESEELTYSAEIWGPEQVPVQKTYATRMGNNKPEALALVPAGVDPGQWFKGYGWIQNTGFDNQSKTAKYFGIPLKDMIPWFKSQAGAALSSAYFWYENGLNEVADTEDFDGVFNEFDKAQDIVNRGHHTARIGDANHWQKRLGYYKRALEVLC
jgi:putative chitinase